VASCAATWTTSNCVVRAKDKEIEEVTRRSTKWENQRKKGDKELTGDPGIQFCQLCPNHARLCYGESDLGGF
jgi:hypothetical protein